jgi:hypothetical protein
MLVELAEQVESLLRESGTLRVLALEAVIREEEDFDVVHFH